LATLLSVDIFPFWQNEAKIVNVFNRASRYAQPRALAGRLRRAQTSLQAIGIDIAFHREGRSGSRVIRMRTVTDRTVCIVSKVRPP